MKILVDTNVILDVLLQREGQVEFSRNFIKLCKTKRHQIYITSMQIRDIEYIAHKYFHNKQDAQNLINTTYSLVTKLLPLSADSAINSIFSDYTDFEDQLLIEAAEEFLLDCIVTDNIKDFAKNEGSMPLFTPKTFIESCSK